MTDPDFHLPRGTQRPGARAYVAVPLVLGGLVVVAVWPLTAAAMVVTAALWPLSLALGVREHLDRLRVRTTGRRS